MPRLHPAAALAAACLPALCTGQAHAHAVAGARVFPVTLTIDDPGVADEYGNTTPTIHFGKGFHELPIPVLRPLALTGTAAFSIADRELKALGPAPSNLGANATLPLTGLPAQLLNNGYSNRWVGGLSLQYSLPYLQW